MYSYLCCYSNVGSVTFLTTVCFCARWLMERSMEKLLEIFWLKIKHFLFYMYPIISLYISIKKNIYIKLYIFCSDDLRNNVGRIDKFQSET